MPGGAGRVYRVQCKVWSVEWVRPSMALGGEGQNIRKAMDELEKIGVGLSKGV